MLSQIYSEKLKCRLIKQCRREAVSSERPLTGQHYFRSFGKDEEAVPRLIEDPVA